MNPFDLARFCGSRALGVVNWFVRLEPSAAWSFAFYREHREHYWP